jgi:hypothetical protein
MRLLRLVVAAGLCLVLLCAGCNSGRKATAKVSGVVTVDGKPMNFGRVQFSPVAAEDALNAGKAGYGYIHADGTFTLTTYKENDGAVVGQHRVTIRSRSRRLPEGQAPPPRDETIPPFETLRLVGQKYEVVAGQENEFQIELTSDQIRKFGEQE